MGLKGLVLGLGLLSLWVTIDGAPKVNITFHEGKQTVAQVDLCDIVRCGADPAGWVGYDVYGCIIPAAFPAWNGWCPTWNQVWWNTRSTGFTCTPTETKWLTFKRSVGIQKGAHDPNNPTAQPIIISLSSNLVNPYDQQKKTTSQLLFHGHRG